MPQSSKSFHKAVPKTVGGAAGWVGGLGAFGGFVIPPVMGFAVGNLGRSGYAIGSQNLQAPRCVSFWPSIADEYRGGSRSAVCNVRSLRAAVIIVERVRTIDPDFALVMATGIVAIAARLTGIPIAGVALRWFNSIRRGVVFHTCCGKGRPGRPEYDALWHVSPGHCAVDWSVSVRRF